MEYDFFLYLKNIKILFNDSFPQINTKKMLFFKRINENMRMKTADHNIMVNAFCLSIYSFSVILISGY